MASGVGLNTVTSRFVQFTDQSRKLLGGVYFPPSVILERNREAAK